MPESSSRLAIDYAALSDRDLAAQAKLGDHGAFRTIMQRCNQRLFRVARSVVRDDNEAEDVLQEAYVRAFAAIGGFRGEASLSTWLTRITLNEARGRLRKRRTNVGLGTIEAMQEEGAQVIVLSQSFGAGTPEHDAARAETRRLMEIAIDELPEPFRVVFIMRAVEELTVEETARQLDILPETVKTRFFRARRQLRQALHEKLASSLTEAFPFLGLRCQRLADAVMERLQANSRGSSGDDPPRAHV